MERVDGNIITYKQNTNITDKSVSQFADIRWYENLNFKVIFIFLNSSSI